jgi:protein-L-isoaspartate(D-aspartate) O-methyltransferase
MDMSRSEKTGARTAAPAITLVVACLLSGACVAEPPDEATQARRREALLKNLGEEIADKRVLGAMATVPRHRFVPRDLLNQAYRNQPLPIGQDQTISQPFIVAYMTQALKLSGREKILEVGTGSGYQAAVLARLADVVYSIEILPELSARAGRVLADLGIKNVRLKVGDGFDGWAEHAPYDGIIVTAAPERVPTPLVEQLKEGGRLVIPLGADWNQQLVTFIKRRGKLVKIDNLAVRFVPMTGKALRESGD